MRNFITLGLAVIFTGLVSCMGKAEDVTREANVTDATTGTAASTRADATASESGSDTKEAATTEEAESSREPVAASGASSGGWSDGDTIPSGLPNVPEIQILKVHNNGTGDPCGMGKTASLKYKAMLADGTVLDPGTQPFSFQVGAGRAIKGWDVVVSRMRLGDSFTILLPQQLAYGPSKGDLKFDMELLSIH